MNRVAKFATSIAVAHLLVNVAHGLAHRELRVDITPRATLFVIVVILMIPLVAAALTWTAARRVGLVLLLLSMFSSLLFGLYHHFLIVSPDHVSLQPHSPLGIRFVLTAYLLLITEAIGTYVGVHFLRIAKELGP